MEQSIYPSVDFSQQNRILEIGCGVGAQTEILLRRFPHLKVQGIDASSAQIKRAEKHLAPAIKSKRADFKVGDALHLPFSENTFDGAFLCWFLEHVQNPVGVLREARRVLRQSSVIYCNEVLNAAFYVHPYSPATLKYWFASNDRQWTLKGDPFVGAKLGNYLVDAGFRDVTTRVITVLLDNRTPKKRADWIEDYTELLLSGGPGLIKAGKIDLETVEEMKRELARLKDDPDAVFFYAWIQARAQVV